MTPLFPCKQYNTCIYTMHLNIFDTRCLELMRGLRVKVRQFFFGRYFKILNTQEAKIPYCTRTVFY